MIKIFPVFILIAINTSCTPSARKGIETKIDTISKDKNQVTVVRKDKTADSDTITETEPGKIFVTVDKQPCYPGGEAEMMKFIMDNLIYPEEAETAGAQVRTVLRFVVTENGSIKDIKVIRGADSLLSEEIIRVIEKMPKWQPGKKDGKNVASYYTLPVDIRLTN